jgi:hypothetical protein
MENEEIPDAIDESQFFLSSETMQEIVRLKEAEKTRFESYWEKDENDIENWTKVNDFLIILSCKIESQHLFQSKRMK